MLSAEMLSAEMLSAETLSVETLASHADNLADCAQNSAADWHRYADDDPPAQQALSRLDIAHTHLGVLADRLAALPPHTGRLDGAGSAKLADQVRDATARIRRPDGRPAPMPVVIDAARTIRDVAALLAASSPRPPSIRVDVSDQRCTLHPPCGCQPIILARHVTVPPLLQPLTCPACHRRRHVAFLGGPDTGLWACWTDQPRPQPGQTGEGQRP
ncbi:MAG: hypothetical protein ACRD0K_22665 [Egibacteraceae bacterium]